MAYLFLFLGLVLLLVGGEFLVKGAVGMALKWNIAPMIVGLTVVSFGTSAPELLVSLQSALNGAPDLAMGNVIGSNIANLALVLGVTALIITIPVEKNTINLDWPVMMGSSILLWFFVQNGVLDLTEGLTLFAILVSYIIYLVFKSNREKKKSSYTEELNEEFDEEDAQRPFWFYLIFLVLGIAGLVVGANWMVDSAKEIALAFGVSEYIIGVTVVAFGTSLPELATSVIAAYRGRTDISVGNLVGSNIFNIMAVLGITSIVHPIRVNDVILSNDIFWFLGVSFIIFPLMMINRKIGKWQGLLLLTIYVLYIYLVLGAA